MTDADATQLPDVRMRDGILHCPHCDSSDLRLESPGIVSCDDCGGRSVRADDQCQQCGARGVTTVEQVGFSLQRVLAGGESVSGDARVQPVVMGLQLALTALWPGAETRRRAMRSVYSAKLARELSRA